MILVFALGLSAAGGFVMVQGGDGARFQGLSMVVLSHGFWFAYCYLQVKSRGWPVGWCALGLLGIFGWVALAVMPQKCLKCGAAVCELAEVEGKYVANWKCDHCGEPFPR